MKNPINIFSEKENEENEDDEDEDKNEEKNLIETLKIAVYLFEWLSVYCENDKNFSHRKKSTGNLISSSNIIYDKNSIVDFNFSEIIINYILKLFYTKNLEVIIKILVGI